jgi:hypothetical protein
LKHEREFSLSARIVSVQRSLSRTLDSFCFFLFSIFSKKSTPSGDTQLKHTKDSKPEESLPMPKKRLIRTVEWVVAILGLLIGAVGIYLSNAPKISVVPSDSLSSYSPMGTTFVLSNDGALEIHELVVTPANLHVENNGPRGFSVVGPWEFTNPPDEAKAPVLSPGHKMGLPYPAAFGFTAVNNFTGGTITFIVRYRPAYLWWRKKEMFPFRAVRTNAGTWIWKSVAQ